MATGTSNRKRACGWIATLAMLAGGAQAAPPQKAPVRLAVVGDSDSHAYHDSLRFSGRGGERGGAYHATTWQWTEALHRLRGAQVDQGAWGRYGTHGAVARAAEWMGWSARAPEKEDFRYNFAISGARCEDLMERERQVPRLVRLMDEAPAQWLGGVVVVRIGVNNFGQHDSLERLAADPRDPRVAAEIDRCIAAVRQSVAYLHRHHPGMRVVLVGVFDNSNIGDDVRAWQSPRPLANIAAALDRYDDALRAIAAGDARVAFFDDRAWFASLWGARADDGTPAYRAISIGGRFRVSNTQGDAPTHAVLADGHAGTAWNALWAKALLDLLNRAFGARIAPVQDAEVLALLPPGGRETAVSGRVRH